MSPMRSTQIVLMVAAAVLYVGCEKKPSSDASRPDGGAEDKYATADPKLAKALRAAADAAAGSDNGPPPGGVFAPGAADQRHPKGMPSKIDVISEGSEPRVSLTSATGPAARPMASGPAMLEVAEQMGPRAALPTVDMALLLHPVKSDDSSPSWIEQADVKKAVPAKDQPGQLSADAEREIAALTGTQILIKFGPSGPEGGLELKLSKPSQSELFAQNAAEALSLAFVPLPAKPVGVGGQWIAETRTTLSGADVIAYRAFQVKSIEGDRLTLALTMSAYAATNDLHLRGVPKGATLEQFEAQGQGKFEIGASESLAHRVELDQRVVMVFRAEGAPSAPTPEGRMPEGNMLTAQLQSQASFVRGEELHASAPRRAGPPEGP
jgi:hypothetical protein